jgi:hypothetical protein
MKNIFARILFFGVGLSLLAGCAGPVHPVAAPVPVVSSPRPPSPTPVPTLTPVPTQAQPSPTLTTAPSATPAATATPALQASGPDIYPPGINPLTGLPARDPELLRLPPALISIPDSPVGARPQMGISSAAWMFEFWIGEGVSRFLGVFYGELPTQGLKGEEPAIGPIRSGRLPYEPLREMFGGFIMMAFASSFVMPQLRYYTCVINENLMTDINGAHTHVSEVLSLAKDFQKKLGSPQISGQRFDPQEPAGGKPAPTLWMTWSFNSQVWWRYNPVLGAYQRWQDLEDGKTFVQATDRLTGQPLDLENLVVLFVDQAAYDPVRIAMNFSYIKKLPALILRDGQIYPVYWTTASSTYERTTGRLRPMRFIDAQGQPFPLKPGHTWVALMTLNSPYYETVDSQDYTWLATKTEPGSGIWAVRYAVPEVMPEEVQTATAAAKK